MRYLIILLFLLVGCEQSFEKKLDQDIKDYYKDKIASVRGKQTADCKFIKGVSPTGKKERDDSGRLSWHYEYIKCEDELYWGWLAWNDETKEENQFVWIKGHRHYLSCKVLGEMGDGNCSYDFEYPKIVVYE